MVKMVVVMTIIIVEHKMWSLLVACLFLLDCGNDDDDVDDDDVDDVDNDGDDDDDNSEGASEDKECCLCKPLSVNAEKSSTFMSHPLRL